MQRMRRRQLSLVMLLWASAVPAAPPAEGRRVVEEIVAVVRSPALGQTRVITRTKLEEEARIALVSRGAVAAAVLPLDEAALRAALEWIIDQTVLIDEVNRLQVFDVDRAEVLEERDRFRARFSRPEDYAAFLGRMDMGEEDLLVVLRRMIRVQRYLESRVRSARIRDAEVEAYWKEHASQFEGRDLASVREPIRAYLAGERLKVEVKSFLADLRGRTEIRVLDRFQAGR
jgi:hypothetical protein